MKVFKINNIDSICAKTKEEAITYCTNELCIEMNKDTEIVECDIKTNTMWYGFYIGVIFHKFIINNRDKVFEIKWNNRMNFDCVVKLTYEQVIKFEDIKESCLIASTEF